MSEMICSRCNALSPQNTAYCQQCGQQLLCKNCQAPIPKDTRFCGQCGQQISERSSNEQVFIDAAATPPGYSRFKMRETADSREFDYMVANEAIEPMSDFISLITENRPLGMRRKPVDDNSQHANLVEVTSVAPSNQPQLPAAESTKLLTEQLEEKRLWEIFSERDGKLVQERLDLKVTGIKDYVIRLASLYLYTQAYRGIESVPREEVFKILEEANVKDSNTSTYIYSSGIRLDKEGKTLRLTSEARGRAQQYITEIFNPDVPDGWHPSNPTRPTNGRAKRTVKKSGERRRTSETVVPGWIANETTQELKKKYTQDVLGKLPLEERALFGLYVLSKAGVTTEVQPTQLSNYLFDAFDLKVSADSIRFKKALNKKPEHVLRRDGEGYRITGSGTTYVEEILSSDKYRK